MLLRFSAANHRSIDDRAEFSMIAVDDDRPSVHKFSSLAEGVLPVAGIYGPNASGKTNVLDAIAWLAQAVHASLVAWDDLIPREPFRAASRFKAPSSYDIEMIVDGVRFGYEVELDSHAVRYETLYSYPERRRRTLFEREDQNLVLRRGLGSLAGTRELLTPTTLALSAAMRFDEAEVRPFAVALRGIASLNLHTGFQGRWRVSSYERARSTSRLFEELSDIDRPSRSDRAAMRSLHQRNRALAMLQLADLGIDDVVFVEGMPEAGRASTPARGMAGRPDLQLIHRIDGEEALFDLAEESAGTQTWFRFIGPMLTALEHGLVLILDEIDASLHPKLSARLIEMFQDPDINPRGAQLIFSTHDTSLLNSLNRDEVWLTEKDKRGATRLTALAEYGGEKVRRSLNLERAYLQGRFGAVPELDQARLKRALGVSGANN
jgi:predicted ATPase